MPRPRRPPRARLSALLATAALAPMFGLISSASSISADDVSNAQSKVDQATTQQAHIGGIISRLTGDIQYLSSRINQIKAAIASLDADIAHQNGVIAEAKATLARILADLAAAHRQLDATKRKLDRDRLTLAHQMVRLYETEPASTINAMLSSGTFDELWQKLIAARRVGDAEQIQVQVVRTEQAQVERIVAQISDDEARQRKTVAAQQAAEKRLESLRAGQVYLQGQLAEAEAYEQRQLAAWEQSKREVDSEVTQLQQALASAKAAKAAREAAARGWSAGGSGQFAWPEIAPLSQGFGCTPYDAEPFDPNCPSLHFHTGIDIAAPYGTDVHAADGGIAYDFYSSYGYGNHVIIIHNNGFSTLYGHLASFAVGSGTPVYRGQVIGYEGSTGNSSGPHLHFEIRLNDVPQNPLAYLP